VVKGRRVILAAWAALLPSFAAGALAQGVATSVRPDRVAVTIYRDPGRYPGNAPNLQWLNGYALISETRQISIPAGESTIRFEGVAGGIVPQSAIVTGFPEGIVERNRDAYLLSPATLLDRSLGRRVHLRRTSQATGAVREQEAVIMSGAGGAVVVQTQQGYETLRCTGLPETLVYDNVPAELSARPTLSVRARASRPVTATVTLSYIASGFDWQANYIASLSADGRHVDLFAWLTLASTDETSFPNADTQAVAGHVNRDEVQRQPREGGPLTLRCWPQARTSDIPLERWAGPSPPPPPLAPGFADGDSIVVTGSRIHRQNLSSSMPITTIMSTQLEDLGDLKLYRIPEPVTVAANSQKQVALMTQPNVRMDLVYRDYFQPARRGEDDETEPRPAALVLVGRNRAEEGLGLPLPAGSFLLYGERDGRPFMLGEGALGDRAVGDKVEVELAATPGVTTRVEKVRETEAWIEYRLIVTSDRPDPIRFESQFRDVGAEFRPDTRLPRRDGLPLWAATVPANGTATLRYRILKAAELRRQEREDRERERREAERDAAREARENARGD
jgi:hypothetical protein